MLAVVAFLIFVVCLVIAIPVSISLSVVSVLPGAFGPSFTASGSFGNVMKESALALLSPVIILGCIYSGITSPTEALRASAPVYEVIRKNVSEKIADQYMGTD